MLRAMIALLLMGTFPAVQETPPPADSGGEHRIPVERLLGAKDLAKFNRSKSYPSRIEILRKQIEARSKRIKSEIPKANLAAIFRTLAEFRGLVYEANELSLAETDEAARRHKEVKRLEIALRKLREQLSTLQLEVPLENRQQFVATMDQAEELRNQLLGQLFGKALEPRSPDTPQNRFLETGLLHPEAAAGSAQNLLDMDKFTEEEYTRIQYAQELVKRVDAFLKIAESRLDEIDRRRKGQEWDKKEPNPLELYTYEDLLHGYYRAVEGIMTNIDSRARSGAEEEKNIRKSLKKLDEKIDGFMTRLQDLESLVRESMDERLYKKYTAALRSSEIARKGAHLGLGGADGKN